MKDLKNSLFSSRALNERDKSKISGGGAYCDTPVTSTENGILVGSDDSMYDG